jgi:hypothetical protein
MIPNSMDVRFSSAKIGRLAVAVEDLLRDLPQEEAVIIFLPANSLRIGEYILETYVLVSDDGI